MPTVPVPITVNGNTYTVPGADTIEPLAASVSYDGTGAAGAFMPCLSIYSQDGHLISRTFPAASVAQGSSSEVSFIPFVPPASGSAGGGGIQFDVDNVGDWLAVETTGFGGPFNAGLYFNDSGGGGIAFESAADANNGYIFDCRGNGNSGFRFEVHDDGNNGGMQFFVGGVGNNGIQILTSDTSSNGIVIDDTSDGGIRMSTSTGLILTVSGSGGAIPLTIVGLPTANPGGTNRVWNNAGVLSIT